MIHILSITHACSLHYQFGKKVGKIVIYLIFVQNSIRRQKSKLLIFGWQILNVSWTYLVAYKIQKWLIDPILSILSYFPKYIPNFNKNILILCSFSFSRLTSSKSEFQRNSLVRSNPVNPCKFVASIFRPDSEYLDNWLIRIFPKNLDFCPDNENWRKYDA